MSSHLHAIFSKKAMKQETKGWRQPSDNSTHTSKHQTYRAMIHCKALRKSFEVSPWMEEMVMGANVKNTIEYLNWNTKLSLTLTLYFFWWKHNYINKCDNGIWSPTNYTTWVVEHVELPIGKTNTPLRKEFPLAPIKKIVTLVLPSTLGDMLSLHVYHRIQKRCACCNYDAIPNTPEIEKWSPSLILGQPV